MRNERWDLFVVGVVFAAVAMVLFAVVAAWYLMSVVMEWFVCQVEFFE